jgi:hypothetical protein
MKEQSPNPRRRAETKKPPATTRAKSHKEAASAPPRPPVAARTGKTPKVDAQARRAMVAQAAYFRAEKRGFDGGGEFDDWIEAEREIARMLDD